MTELFSILFFILGLGILYAFIKLSKLFHHNTISHLALILFFFLWNSEYLAASLFFLAIVYGWKLIKDSLSEAEFSSLVKCFLITIIYTFLFRKTKDIVMQSIIEQNIQNIK